MDDVGYVHLRSGAPLPPLSFAPFKALVIADEAVDEGWRADVCAWLIGHGCLAFAAWGEACEAWHDDADDINIAAFAGGDIPEDRLVMTTWHDDEPLAQALWFVAVAAFHPTTELTNALIVHVAPRERGKALLELYRVAADD